MCNEDARAGEGARRSAGNTPALLSFLLVLLGGCVSFPHQEDSQEHDLVARNLILSLVQVPQLYPSATMVQIDVRGARGFEAHVHARLADAGYGVQRVVGGEGPNAVTVSVENGSDFSRTYSLTIATFSITRSYGQRGGRTVPLSAQYLEGVETQGIAIDDSMFEGRRIDLYSTIVSGPITDRAAPVEAIDDAGLADSGGLIKQNMYKTLESNYADLLTDYEEVRQDVLVFADDSLRLGDTNKSIVESYARELQPETDVVSVIGCSHGKSSINNGNEVLALGRAGRVKEAFLFAGISHTRVWEEGCWSAQEFSDVMPARGVLLTLKRR